MVVALFGQSNRRRGGSAADDRELAAVLRALVSAEGVELVAVTDASGRLAYVLDVKASVTLDGRHGRAVLAVLDKLHATAAVRCPKWAERL